MTRDTGGVRSAALSRLSALNPSSTALPSAEAEGWLDASMLLRFRDGVLAPRDPTRMLLSLPARLTSAVRPPIIAGLLLVLGIAAALPFRRTDLPSQPDKSIDAAARGDTLSSRAPVGGSRGPASPLRVTSDPQQTAEKLLAAFPNPTAAPADSVAVPQAFRESYAEKAVELVELPRRVDRWDPPSRAESSSSFAEPRLPEPQPRSGASPPETMVAKENVPATPATIRQPREPQPADPSDDYRWQSVSAPEETSSAAEELPAPTRRQRSSAQTHATEPVSSTARLPHVKAAEPRTPASDAVPARPQPRRRYFIREPVFDSATSR